VHGNAFSRLALLDFLLAAETDIGKLLVNAQLAAGLDACLAGASPHWFVPRVLQEVCDSDIMGVAAHPITGESLGNGYSDSIFRLREGIERFLITDVACSSCAEMAESGVWIMFDQSVPVGRGMALNHQPAGSNVLYMDGHVAYIRLTHGVWDATLRTWRDGAAVPPVMPSIIRTIGAIGASR
jgi:prepilin-type processing-associated H-X9-DG protein